MKKIIVLLLVLATMGISHAQNPQKIIRFTSLEWPPYCGGQMEGQGFVIKNFKEKLQPKGIGVIVDFFPWSRAIMLAVGSPERKSEYNGILPVWPEEVPEGFYATKPIGYSTVDIISRKDMSIKDRTLSNLFANHRVALVKDYKYSQEIESFAATYKHNLVRPGNDQLAVRMLMAGRFDILMTDFRVADYYARKGEYYDIEKLEMLYKKPLVAAINGDEKELVELLNSLLP